LYLQYNLTLDAARTFFVGEQAWLVHNTCSVTLDLFGGRTSQIPGATNVDIIATDGIKANALELPFVNGSIDEIIISNPYLQRNGMTSREVRSQLFAEINRVLTDEGEVYINTQVSNPFTNFRSGELESYGFTIQRLNSVHPDFANLTFTKTDGDIIQLEKMYTIILRRQ
jgi:hypothetical protein